MYAGHFTPDLLEITQTESVLGNDPNDILYGCNFITIGVQVKPVGVCFHFEVLNFGGRKNACKWPFAMARPSMENLAMISGLHVRAEL